MIAFRMKLNEKKTKKSGLQYLVLITILKMVSTNSALTAERKLRRLRNERKKDFVLSNFKGR
jgi:predicted GIY-YIG superfamily endonuclease